MAVRAQKPLDYQLMFQPHVVIIDARGKAFPIHLETIDALEVSGDNRYHDLRSC